MAKKLRIAACGGGTGGHYYPALSVLKKLKEYRNLEIMYFTVPGKIDDRSVEKDLPGVKRVPLQVKGLKRPLRNLKNLGILKEHLLTEIKVRKLLREFKPDFVFSTGGFISYPVIKSAQKLGIKSFLHEQNSIPGIANKRMARHADKVFVSFEESAKRFPDKAKVICTGNPVRKVTKTREELLDKLNFSHFEPFVVVMGGSLGSEIINNLMLEMYRSISVSDEKINFLHSTGDSMATAAFSEFPFVKAADYIDDLHEYVSIADGVVSRGGATTIAELLHYKTPGIIIPWPGATENHQYHNALSLEKRELGYVIIENESTADKIHYLLKKLLTRNLKITENSVIPVDLIIDYLLQEE